jgi:hypothetical protein
VGGASALTLADAEAGSVPAIWTAIRAGILRRTTAMLVRRAALDSTEGAILTRFHWEHERALPGSIGRFAAPPASFAPEAGRFFDGLETATGRPTPAPPSPSGAGAIVYRRNPDLKGPMSAFAYDYFNDHYGTERAGSIRLLDYEGLRGSGGDYAYEVLNFVDGHRTVSSIRDAVSAIYGPIPVEVVAEYLTALATIDVVRR